MGIATVSSGTTSYGLSAQGYMLNRATNIDYDVLVTHHTRTARNTNKKPVMSTWITHSLVLTITKSHFDNLWGESDWASAVLKCVDETPCTLATTPCLGRTQPSARTKRVTRGQGRTLSSQSGSRQTGAVPPHRGEDSLVYSANPNYSTIPTNRAHSPTDRS